MDFPKGVRSRGSGLEISIWKNKQRVFYEYIPGDPNKKANVKAAFLRLEDKRARYRLGLPLQDESVGTPSTFRAVAEDYLNALDIGPKQQHDYRKFLNNYWIPAFGSWLVTDVRTAHIKKELAKMNGRIKTKKNRLIPLRGVFQHAEVVPNPVAAIKWPRSREKAEKQKVIRYRPNERDQLLIHLDLMAKEYLAKRNRLNNSSSQSDAFWSWQATYYFRLMFAIGPRPGEALGIDCEDYDGESIRLWKQRSESKEVKHTKTGTERTVHVPDWVKPHLDSLKAQRRTGPLFLSLKGEPLMYRKRLNEMWQEAHKRAGLEYRVPYTCRHTRAAELLSQGVNPAEAANELGHSTDMFLNKYSEFIKEYQGDRDKRGFESNTPSATPIPHGDRG